MQNFKTLYMFMILCIRMCIEEDLGIGRTIHLMPLFLLTFRVLQTKHKSDHTRFVR